jgi:hypothetical protein
MSTHLLDLSLFPPWLVGQSEGLIDVHTPVEPVNVPSLDCRPAWRTDRCPHTCRTRLGDPPPPRAERGTHTRVWRSYMLEYGVAKRAV